MRDVVACNKIIKELHSDLLNRLSSIYRCIIDDADFVSDLSITKVSLWNILASLFVSVCLSACWSRPRALQKRLNRSRCRLGSGFLWAHGTMIRMQIGATRRMRLNYPCAAAMRPLATFTLTTCLQDRLADARQRLQSIAEKQSPLISSRSELGPVATHASMLYSLLSLMPAVNHMYHTSLHQLMLILRRALHR